ncbi:MAG TPA: hypothetical protein DCP31_13905 [Cyanobacteria bacterium UBA8543]|nr:hypothetical protein [Cyanobacteria bacterium UBA8543]
MAIRLYYKWCQCVSLESMSFSPEQRLIIEAKRATEGIPGVAAAIVKDGEILAAEGFGYRNLEQKLPMTAQTVFPVCSLTKSFTGVAIMQLVEAGKLALDEPVVSYLPDFRIADAEASRKITPRILLSHQSGLGRTGHQDRMFKEENSPYSSRADLVKQLSEVKSQTQPNVTWSYCNEGYAILGLLVDTISGISLEEYFQNRIFDVVGMKESYVRFAQWREAENRSHTYQKQGNNYQETNLPKEYNIYLASGGICSTVSDVARYQIASLDYTHSTLLSAGFLDQMHTISRPYGDTGWGYGLGWMIAWSGDRKICEHGGRLAGVSTHSLMIPAAKLGVVVLSNLGGAPSRNLALQLAENVVGEELFPLSSQHNQNRFSTRFPVPDAATLQQYVGTYVQTEKRLHIAVENEQLVVHLGASDNINEREVYRLTAVAPDWFMESMGGQIYFIRAKDGNVTSVLIGGGAMPISWSHRFFKY